MAERLPDDWIHQADINPLLEMMSRLCTSVVDESKEVLRRIDAKKDGWLGV